MRSNLGHDELVHLRVCIKASSVLLFTCTLMPRTIGMHVFNILYRYVMFTYKILLMLGIPIIQSLKKLNKIFDIPPLTQKKPTNDKPRNSHPE